MYVQLYAPLGGMRWSSFYFEFSPFFWLTIFLVQQFFGTVNQKKWWLIGQHRKTWLTKHPYPCNATLPETSWRCRQRRLKQRHLQQGEQRRLKTFWLSNFEGDVKRFSFLKKSSGRKNHTKNFFLFIRGPALVTVIEPCRCPWSLAASECPTSLVNRSFFPRVWERGVYYGEPPCSLCWNVGDVSCLSLHALIGGPFNWHPPLIRT